MLEILFGEIERLVLKSKIFSEWEELLDIKGSHISNLAANSNLLFSPGFCMEGRGSANMQ